MTYLTKEAIDVANAILKTQTPPNHRPHPTPPHRCDFRGQTHRRGVENTIRRRGRLQSTVPRQVVA